MSEFADWLPAPNIRDAPELYEIENHAFDPDGLVLSAMRDIAPWANRTLLDLGCGTGFWLPGYAAAPFGAEMVVGVEPDPVLREGAQRRVAGMPGVQVLAGSAEHLPLPDASVDVIHTRFAYFGGPGCEPGLAEARRVLRPGGRLVAIDNDLEHGEFADLLRAAGMHTGPDEWWSRQGASRQAVLSEWRFGSAEDCAAVLRNEFRDGTADDWLATHPGRTGLSYGYVLYSVAA